MERVLSGAVPVVALPGQGRVAQIKGHHLITTSAIPVPAQDYIFVSFKLSSAPLSLEAGRPLQNLSAGAIIIIILI